MSVEENKAIARRWNDEIWSKGNLAVIDELFATDFVWHYAPPGVAPDLEGYRRYQTESLAAFADMNCVIEVILAEGDKVARRVTWTGTHKGTYMGIAPTGKQVTLTVITIERIEGGKIAEQWGEADMLGLMQQLGVMPSPGEAKARP